MRQSKRMAACGVVGAACVVLMLLGQALGIGLYASPMIAGLCLLPIGKLFGVKDQLLVYLAVSLLSLLVVSDPEQNLMFICIFGWYPAVYDALHKLRQPWRFLIQLAVYNAVLLAVQMLVTLLMPQTLTMWMWALLFVLFNVTFFLYDCLIPRAKGFTEKLLRDLLHLYD